MNQQHEAINTNCINHTQDWTLENTHSHKELLKYGTIFKTSKVVTAPTTMSFESRLDKFWENQPRKYNYSHEIVINTTGHDLSITRLDEELTDEASCGDLQSEENL